MSWVEGAKFERFNSERPVKDNELVTNESTPLHRFWGLVQAGATLIRVRDSRGWRYDFECTTKGDAAATACRNYVSNVRLTFKPKCMESEEIVSVRQVSVVSPGGSSAKVISYCFEIGPWRTGTICLDNVTYV